MDIPPNASPAVQVFVAVADFLKALVWPGIAAWFLYHHRAAIGDLLGGLSEFTLEAGSFKASARKKAEVAAALGAAEEARAAQETRERAASAAAGEAQPATLEPSLAPQVSPGQAASIAATVDAALPGRKADRMGGATILWVDDRPSNNAYERRAFEALGIEVHTSLSTEDALARLKQFPYDLVITDMGRAGDPDAGFTLIAEMNKQQPRPPVVVYAGAVAQKKRDQIVGSGAWGSTNRPQELFSLVTSALQARGRGRTR